MKKNNKQDERIKHSRILELQEKESTRQRGDTKYRTMINKFRKGIGLKPQYPENMEENYEPE
ncbi:hypothetical protein GH811_18325 [Acetobacterium malicum]|uniref:Uncharacterized protein n=1 Tax=Acetobacterium malicum TaxID=52692 RepID=A0ABR6Z2G3_9FIRM|nr:hypothetical protein [Acetobacterium malicum]MBC3901559.1 hypothetical protein [Acetobacterium malicum]